jgi:hypothetical protein
VVTRSLLSGVISALIWIVISLASGGSALFVVVGALACLVGGSMLAYAFGRLRSGR